MTTLTLSLVAAAAALVLSTLFRVPAAPLAILAGVGLSAAGAPLDAELVTDGLLLAATFLVFAVGTQLERQALARYRPAAIGIAGLYLAVTAAIALAMSPLLDLEGWTLVYLVLALGSSSTLLVVDLLRRRRLSFDPVGRFTTGVAVTQDAVVIIALALLTPAFLDATQLATRIAAVLALLVIAWACARWLAPAVLARGRVESEEQLLFVLAVLFTFSGLAWGLGLPAALGAYLAGTVFSRFPVGGIVRGHVASFADFFTVLFFVLLGALVGIPHPDQLAAEVILILTVLVLRPILLLPIVRRLQMTVRASMQSMTMLAQSGELGLIVVVVAAAEGRVGNELISTVAAVVMVTMAVVPFLSSDRVTWWLTHAYPRRRRQPETGRKAHLIVIGAGEGGGIVLDRLEGFGVDIVVIEDDPAVFDGLVARGVPAVRGDGTDGEILRAAGADRAAAIVSTMRSAHDNERLLELVRDTPVLMRAYSAEEAERLRELGGHPVVDAELSAAALVRWYEEHAAQ